MANTRPKLPPQRAAVLAFIKARVEKVGKFPATSEIAHHIGWRSSSSALDMLHHLACDGYLRKAGRRPDGNRSIIWELA